jgi:hypothetical protein
MSFFTGGISTAGRAAIDGAAAGALQLGYVRIGSMSRAGGTTMSNQSTNAVGNITQLAANKVFYTVFGSNRIVLFTELEMVEELVIGNLVFFLSNGTPLAWGQFDYNIRKEAKGPDTAGDWIMLALSIEKPNLRGKFTLNSLQSTAFELPEAETNQSAIIQYSKNRKIVVAAKETVGNFDHPSIMFKGRKWFINPFCVPVNSDFEELTGGVLSDSYDRSI